MGLTWYELYEPIKVYLPLLFVFVSSNLSYDKYRLKCLLELICETCKLIFEGMFQTRGQIAKLNQIIFFVSTAFFYISTSLYEYHKMTNAQNAFCQICV